MTHFKFNFQLNNDAETGENIEPQRQREEPVILD